MDFFFRFISSNPMATYLSTLSVCPGINSCLSIYPNYSRILNMITLMEWSWSWSRSDWSVMKCVTAVEIHLWFYYWWEFGLSMWCIPFFGWNLVWFRSPRSKTRSEYVENRENVLGCLLVLMVSGMRWCCVAWPYVGGITHRKGPSETKLDRFVDNP